MGKKAVVLGGGGSRGSYQIGVWKALQELDFDYEIVTGTSVGALNGAMMVQKDYELAEHMWQKLKTSDVMDVAVTDKIEGRKDLTGKVGTFLSEMVKNGGADPRPLEQMLRGLYRRGKNSPVPSGIWIHNGGISAAGAEGPFQRVCSGGRIGGLPDGQRRVLSRDESAGDR